MVGIRQNCSMFEFFIYNEIYDHKHDLDLL